MGDALVLLIIMRGVGARVVPIVRAGADDHGETADGRPTGIAPSASPGYFTGSRRLKRAALTVTSALKVRLNRKKLCERLLLEEKTKRGLRRLINQIFIFIFTIAALKTGGGGEDVKRGLLFVSGSLP